MEIAASWIGWPQTPALLSPDVWIRKKEKGAMVKGFGGCILSQILFSSLSAFHGLDSRSTTYLLGL